LDVVSEYKIRKEVDMLITKRNLLRGMFAMPAIVMIDNIMPVKLFDIPKRPEYTLVPESVWIAPYKGKVLYDEAFYYAPYIPVTKTKVTPHTRSIGSEWTIEIPQEVIHVYDPSIETMIRNMVKNKPL
jgi:hypothetical protein